MDEAEILLKARAHPLLAILDAPVLKAVVRAARLVPYRAGRSILKEGEPPKAVFALLSGAVRVFHREGESEVLLKLFRAPALFGEMEVLGDRPFLEHVITLEASQVLHIPAVTFRQVVNSQPALSHALCVDLSARLCIAAENQKALAFCDVDTRLANLLLDYAEFFGETDEEGLRLTVALTQQSMAGDLAVTRKALGAGLKKLKEQGILDKKDARYLIRDVDALRARGFGTLGLSYAIDRKNRQDADEG